MYRDEEAGGLGDLLLTEQKHTWTKYHYINKAGFICDQPWG